jgi:hypothetical protein
MRGGRKALDEAIARAKVRTRGALMVNVHEDVMAELTDGFSSRFANLPVRYDGWPVSSAYSPLLRPGGWEVAESYGGHVLARSDGVWRSRIKTLYITGARGNRWEWHNAGEFCELPGPTPGQFTLGESDYDRGSDDLICPCGHIEQRGETLGEMLEQAQAHLDEAHGGGWRD